MGSIDSLHFEVILDHDKFDKEIKKVQDAAKDLNTTMSSVLNLTKQAKAAFNGASSATSSAAAAQTKYTNAVKSTNTALSNTSSLMRTISQLTGIAFGVTTLRRFASELMTITGQFEVQKMALTSMLQSAEVADDIFNRLRQNALNSPYTFADLTKFAKQLTAFNIPTDKLIETEKMLADVAAGLGVDMGRIILAYGQVKAAGALKGTELRQFTEAGVPILEVLAKQIEEVEGKTIALSEVFNRITKKQIPFEMVEEAFRRMTSEGGKFYNMQEVLVETLQGKISKLRDVWQQALYDLGMSQEGLLKGSVDFVTKLVSHLDVLGRIIGDVIVGLGGYAAGMAMAKVVTIDFESAMLDVGIAFEKVWIWIKKNPYAVAGALIGVAAYEIIKWTNKTNKELKELRKNLDDIHEQSLESAGMNEVRRLKSLYDVAKDMNKAYDERKDAITILQSMVPSYHANLSEEGKLIEKNKVALDNYIASLEREARTKGAQDELSQLYNEKRLQERAIQDAQTKINNARSMASTAYTGYQSITGAGDMVGAIASARIALAESDLAREEKKLQEIDSRIARVNAELARTIVAGPISGEGRNWDPDWNKKKEDELEKRLKEEAKAAEDAKKALLDYIEAIRRWENEDNGLWGEGVVYDVRKALAAYNEAINKNDTRALNMIISSGKAYKDSPVDQMREIGRIMNLWAESRAGALSTLKNTVSGLADKIFKDALDGYELSDWGDKTLSQIKEIEDVIEGIDVPEDIKTMLKTMLGPNFDSVLKSLKAELNNQKMSALENTIDPEKWKKIKDNAAYIAKQFVSVAKSLKTFADASGNRELSDFATAVGAIAQNIEAAQEGYKAWGGWWGAVIGGASDLIQQVLEGLTSAESKAVELQRTLADTFRDNSIANFAAMLDKAGSGIFGDNPYGRAQLAIKQLRELKNVISETNGIVGGDNTNVGLRGANGSYAVQFTRDMGGVFSPHPDRWGIERIAAETGMSVLDEYGNFNVELLRWIKNAGWELTEAENEWLDQAIIHSEEYAAAMKSVEETVESIVGDIASSAADSIIEGWIEAGDAALDYADILDDVAKAYAKMIVQDIILGQVFNDEHQKELMNAFGDGANTGEFMSMIAADMEKINALAPVISDALAPFAQYVTGDGSSTSNSVGSGIKSITEETASLLASYINAIRADVSVIRGVVEKNIGNTNGTPTLNDYLAQIAASNQSILSELQSVIGSQGSDGMVVRVQTM